MLFFKTEWADKKVVIFALPGAFTPSCSASHLPGFIAKRDELLKKGVDVIACLAYNDPFVMSAWGKANNVKGEDIVRFCRFTPILYPFPSHSTTEFKNTNTSPSPQLFLTDENAEFSKAHGWTLGERTSRYALVIDHGKVTYAEVEPSPQFGVSVSSAESVLEKL